MSSAGSLAGRRPHGTRRALGVLWAMCAALMLLAALPAAAQGPLSLDGERAQAVDAWAAVTLLPDPGGRLSLDDVLQRRDDFTPPTGPHANLGVRQDPVWLRVPVKPVADDNGQWVLAIDYPSLDRIDVHVVAGSVPLRSVALGDHLRLAERPMATRSHAVALSLAPGEESVLYLRVHTRSSMSVPIQLSKAGAFHAEESAVQMVQGLLAGVALCLMLYALGQWLGSRDPMFLYYAIAVAGIALFFFSYYGVGAQYLWARSAWMTDNAAPVFVLLGLGGTSLLVDRLLDVRTDGRRLSLALRAIAVLAFVTPALFVGGLLSYRAASLVATVLGPLPVVLAAGFAWRRARAGDEAARYVLLGWSTYAVGVAVQAALLRGAVDSNVWTQHSFQAGWLCEIVAFLRVLGVRAGAYRRQAARAQHERELMSRMAHTDALTGLPNRRGLDLALQDMLAQASPTQGLAVYVIDLDGFKDVNDRLGHDAGDALLKQAAARLRGSLRSHDVVARLGGDEFVILARSISDEAVAWRLGEKLLSAFESPFEILDGHACKVGLTVGFALAPQDGSQGADLLRRADAAMYTGKRAGKGTVRRGGASAGLASV